MSDKREEKGIESGILEKLNNAIGSFEGLSLERRRSQEDVIANSVLIQEIFNQVIELFKQMYNEHQKTCKEYNILSIEVSSLSNKLKTIMMHYKSLFDTLHKAGMRLSSNGVIHPSDDLATEINNVLVVVLNPSKDF